MSFRSRSSGEEPHTTISSPPDDLVLSCLARVSRLYYRTLSFVSKKFLSLISSPELYKVRSLLGRTESCLYVCLELPPRSDLRWFTLCQQPDTDSRKNSSDNLLVSIPFPHSAQAFLSSAVVIGSSIYSIGGNMDGKVYSKVSILDCRSHEWHQAPNMQVARMYPAANVIDGKIYVIGGCTRIFYDSSNWIEAFDPKTQTWNYVSDPGKELHFREIIHRTEIDGKICIYGGGGSSVTGKGMAYNPKDGKCERLELDMCKAWKRYPHCVIENVLFYYNDKEAFKWFDTENLD